MQIIGEAVNHLPDEIIGVHPEIAWPQIRGFRNILVHQYFRVDIDVWRRCRVPLGSRLERLAGDRC